MEYEMFTPEGNSAIANLLTNMEIALSEKPLPDCKRLLHQYVGAIAEKHGEVWDTEPRYHLANGMSRKAKKVLDIDLDIDYWGLLKKATITINRNIVKRNKKLTKKLGFIVDDAAISVRTYNSTKYTKRVDLGNGCVLIQDAMNARCNGATIFIECEDADTLEFEQLDIKTK